MARKLTNTSQPARGRRSKTRKRLKIAFGMFLILGSIFVVAATLYAKEQLDKAAKVVNDLPERMKLLTSERTVICARDGTVMESIATEFRRPVRLGEIPSKVQLATLAAEDKRFYDHQGVDYWAVGRATISTLTGRGTQGASTLTMQLAKRVYTSNAKTLDRKIEDMALATMIERNLTKKQILELYLNQVYYGSGAYGISAAAEVYFGKDLDKLTYSEAAILARCVRRPSDVNPIVSPKVALENRNDVLATMLQEKWISKADYDKALAEPLKLKKSKVATGEDRIAPYFCDYVKAWIKENEPDIELTKGGYRIETTLDLKMQKYAEAKVRDMVAKNRRLKITTCAFAMCDRDGRILAMVGGPDYDKNQYNVITQGHRQPGSAFKPLVYATAFEVGALSPYGSVSNEPFIRTTHPLTYIRGGGKGGSVSVVSAIAKSINTPAMWAAKEAGLGNVVQMSHIAFGIQTQLPEVPTIALGAGEVTPLELLTAYSVFQNGGDRFTAFGVEKLIGADGVPVRINGPTFERHVISPATVEGIEMCLRRVVTGGTGSAAGYVTNARGKTGTTSDNKDAWFCGYTDKYIAVGWVANETKDDNGRVRYQPMNDYVMGGHMVAPLWARIIDHAQGLYGEKQRSLRAGHDIQVSEADAKVPDEVNPGIVDDTSPDPDAGTTTDTAPDLPEGTTEIDPGAKVVKPPKIDERPAPRREPQTTPTESVVFVEICADSGLRATIYCPERVRRAFRAGAEPKKRCNLHRAGVR